MRTGSRTVATGIAYGDPSQTIPRTNLPDGLSAIPASSTVDSAVSPDSFGLVRSYVPAVYIELFTGLSLLRLPTRSAFRTPTLFSVCSPSFLISITQSQKSVRHPMRGE